jgi:hypothetical protein
MKLLAFLREIRKQGADISRINIRVKAWDGIWTTGIPIVSLRGNRITVLSRPEHAMTLQSGHVVLNCTVDSITKQRFERTNLREKSPAFILDLTPAVARTLDW